MSITYDEIDEQYSKLYDEISNLYTYDIVKEKLNGSNRPINEKLLVIIFEIDYKIGNGLLNGKYPLQYWKLVLDEIEILEKICNEATEENALYTFYKAFDEYFNIFFDKNLSYYGISYEDYEDDEYDDMSDEIDY